MVTHCFKTKLTSLSMQAIQDGPKQLKKQVKAPRRVSIAQASSLVEEGSVPPKAKAIGTVIGGAGLVTGSTGTLLL